MSDNGTKAQIYAAARKLFSERGYHGTAMRDIAGEVGIRGASIYSHIAGKEDLLWDMVCAVASEFETNVGAALNGPQPPEEKLRQAIAAHIAVIAANIESAIIYFHEWKALTGERYDAIRKRRDRYEKLFRNAFAEGVEQGAFRARNPKHLSLMLLSALNGIYTWYRPDAPLNAEQLGAMYADVFLGGILNTERKGSRKPQRHSKQAA